MKIKKNKNNQRRNGEGKWILNLKETKNEFREKDRVCYKALK